MEHGFAGNVGSGLGGSAESLAVIDTREAWVFHILPDDTGKSAIWTAQRVPEGHAAVIANMFVIREIDLTDVDGAREDFLLANPEVARRVRELETARDTPPPAPAERARRGAGAQPPARFDRMIFSVLSAPSQVSSGLASAANALQRYLQQRMTARRMSLSSFMCDV